MTTPDPISLFDRLMAVKPTGLSPNAWTGRAGVNRSVFNDIRKRDSANVTTLEKLLSAIGVTLADFEAGVRAVDKYAPALSDPLKAPVQAFRGDDRPRDVPIVGSAECGEVEFASDGGVSMIEAMELDFDNVVDHVRRPVTLDNKREVYAIYYTGHSMAPRYETGELGYVDPGRPPKVRDYVIVQLRRPDHHDGERVCRVLAKRLVRMSASYIELEQFNPPAIFRVDRKEVKHIHRIIPWDELVSF
ncbi:S24 family peptidase [Sphingomonas sp. Leaf28]|uniref:S24 family peptidase n=1 Tax=Sphingomonas sp. Leaf28 TaxID=1735695 RepID=UPI0006FF5A8D|nr:S24 family peptidase [Sphingomonas sp. Leaf28]KQN12024.1 hypothetical protein ASE79_08375 [Sphingomonas sp. Leaf28]